MSARREFEKLPFTMSLARYGYGNAQCRRDLQQRAVLEGLVGGAAVGGLADGDILARIEPDDLAGADLDAARVVLVLGRGQRVLRRGRGDEHRIHRRDLLPVELGIVILIEQEQLHDGGRQFRDAAQLTALHRVDHMDHLGGRHPRDLAREARLGAVARVAAQEVIGDAPPDPVELDALTDRIAIGRGAALFQRQHFRGQHLQLQRHAQPVARAPRPDPEEHLARDEDLARRAALQPVEIGQPLGIGLVGPGKPEPLQLFLAGGIAIFEIGLIPSPAVLAAQLSTALVA